jgi:subtilisin family serine protease
MLVALVAFPVSRATMQTEDDAPAARTRSKGPKAEFVPGRVLVRFRTGEALAQVSKDNSAVVALRARNGREIPVEVESFQGSELVEGLRIARVAPEDTLRAIEALSARPDVLYAEPDYIRHAEATPNDPSFPSQYALQRISAQAAWDRTTGNNSVVVAVLDGGVDITHPDLQGNIWTNPGEIPNNNLDDDANGFVDDVNGWDFAHGDKTVYDAEEGDDHATHVAGTIGARGNNGTGITGVNWRVSIMSVKVLSPSSGSSSALINGYNYVRVMRERGVNVRVTNNSYGGGGKSQSELAAIKQLNAAGILFVAAAGNDSTDNFSFPHFPSNYDAPNIIAVASSNSTDGLSGFSNFGARAVSMGAPGSSILSTVPTFIAPSGYATYSGTSMAAPHVSGAAALVLSVSPNIPIQNLRGVLAFTGDVLPALEGRTTTGRRLNANAAVASAQENDTTAPAVPSNLQITSQNGRGVTLSWTAPGDDGNSGSASDYDFSFINPTTGARLLLPTTVLPAPAGSAQSATVNLPFRNFSGTIELKTYDNAGNASTVSVPVTVAQNAGTDPYVQSLGAASGLTTGGTSLNLTGDDVFRENHPLPFSFPFFGTNRTSVTVSSNGALYFSRIPQDRDDAGNFVGLDPGSSIEGLNGQTMIAGMWDDLRTDSPGGGVFVVQPDSNRVIFRWQGVTFDTPLGSTTRGENPVNMEIELRSDGTIIMRYGAGQAAPTNTRLFPVVGISGGEPDAYVVASHTSEFSLKNLTNAQTVTFSPRPVVVPNVAPTVSITNPPDGAVLAAPANFTLTAVAADTDGTVTSVDFYSGPALIGTVLSNGTGQFALPLGNVAAQTIVFTAVATDNTGARTTSAPITVFVSGNPIDDAAFFVRQHYLDFFGRQADDSGLAFWTANINSCGLNPQCREVKRIDTSAAFFLSIEFQETGYLVHRFYKAAYGDIPGTPVPLRLAEFLPDTQRIDQGVIIGQPGAEALLESNKAAYANEFVARPRFTAAYPAGMSPAAFVAALNANTGNSLSPTEEATLAAELTAGTKSRAQVLRAVAENAEFTRRERNRAFVLSQYFGYLRRDPDAAPNTDFAGYNFWLGKLNEFGGDFRRAEMVKAFITSGEYRQRFGTP